MREPFINKSKSSQTQPLVSIIIPSFNQGKFIGETIDSILLQSYRPIEIIIIDACSSDDTINKLHKYDNVPEVKWLSEPDKGQADGVNKGFVLAKGKIYAWLNSDDVYYSSDVVAAVVDYFAKNPILDVIYGDVAVISADSTLLRLFLLPPFKKDRILRQNFISQPAVFFRRYVAENEILNINQVGLDYEYWLRLVIKGYHFSHFKKILACDRHYPGRVSVIKKSLIDSQIAILKSKMGISRLNSYPVYLVDRMLQAICRLKGLINLLLMPLIHNKSNIVFPIKIDSYLKLFWRQLTKQIGSDFKL